MDEHISREEVVKKIKSCISTASDAWESGYNAAMAEIMEWIKHIPAADIQPVKHGIWLDNPNQSQLYSYICSNCRNSCDWTYRYCPNCGSKNRMDGDSE